ncbi:uncharacterized protein [Paramisgurnus dabryanus]|uniref:uncharacterized protein n=1 Tax=Paramisgurnus dabryanus TaxID=90735 RepID=UPI0031F3D109
MDASLKEFLIKRNIGEDVIQKLEDENIDKTVIPMMTDSDLAKYIPKAGDRISTVAFCRQVSTSNQSQSRKDTILSRLRHRLSSGDDSIPAKKSSSWIGNSNAKKTQRRIELGWMDFDEKEQRYKQVKAINGGGTRHLSLDKNKTVKDVKDDAEILFFPNGYSKKQKKLSHYTTDIECSQVHVEMSKTIEQLYSESKVRILRLYLCTKMKPEEQSSDEDEAVTAVIDLNDSETENVINSVSSVDSEITLGASESETVQMDDTLPWDHFEHQIIEEPFLAPETVIIVTESGFEVPPLDELNPDGLISTRENFLTSPVIDEIQSVSTPETLLGDNGVPAQIGHELQPSVATLIVRRGQCLTDLISAFKNPDVINTEVHIKMRLPNGDLEEGEGIGVFRDCLTEFWTDFYDSCTLGVDVKVPFIRHDYQYEEWQAVARVFVVGWKQASYLPVKLATPFLEEVLYGTTTSSLKDSLLLYVSEQERAVLMSALKDFDSVDSDELFDVLDAHECKQVPNKDTLIPLLAQIGHKAIIQAPMYVIECWRPIMVHVASMLPPDGLHQAIKQKKPTAKIVKELLHFPDDMTAAQAAVARYLKKYIGEIDLNTLQLFLRFCTGSDLMDRPITIEFVETSDFLRRPQTHTCGCILKLPVGYHSYPDLRSEFNKILTSSVWAMDII